MQDDRLVLTKRLPTGDPEELGIPNGTGSTSDSNTDGSLLGGVEAGSGGGLEASVEQTSVSMSPHWP